MIASPSSTIVDPRQTELLQLQKEYRHMEINRRAYADESQAVLRKQQGTIDKLRKDNDSLKADIATIMRGTNKVMSLDQQEALSQLNEQGDKFVQQIEFEQKNIIILEEQIAIMREKALQQRKTMGGVNASKENHAMIVKQIRILENRLDKSLIKFNESIKQNKTLRDEIDNLRRERVVFENIYRKMERDLQEKKKQMAEIIEMSNQSYEQRDTFQMEIAAIEQANRKEIEEFEEQMLTLGKLLDNELQLPAPGMSTAMLTGTGNHNNNGTGKAPTSSHASLPSLPRLENSSHQSKNGNSIRQSKSAGGMFGHNHGGNMSSSTSIASNGDMASITSPSHTNQGGGNNNFDIDYRERAQNFEEAFNKIKAATGIHDIDELVKTFIQNEEHNFSLFNYVNEQNNEVEKLEEAITALREEEMKYAQESGNDVNQHKEILKDLEMKLLTTDNMAEKYELRCQDLTRIIESLKRGLQHVFSLFYDPNNNANTTSTEADQSNTSAVTSSGEVPIITEVNMVNYLAVLEKKTNELLQSYRHIQSLLTAGNNNSNEGSTSKGGVSIQHQPLFVTVLGSGPKVPMGSDHLHVNPPKADDLYRYDNAMNNNNNNNNGFDDTNGSNMSVNVMDEEEEEETRPLTRDELKYRTLSRIQRRLNNTGGNNAGNNMSSNKK